MQSINYRGKLIEAVHGSIENFANAAVARCCMHTLKEIEKAIREGMRQFAESITS